MDSEKYTELVLKIEASLKEFGEDGAYVAFSAGSALAVKAEIPEEEVIETVNDFIRMAHIAKVFKSAIAKIIKEKVEE
jgi:hypothetical protein